MFGLKSNKKRINELEINLKFALGRIKYMEHELSTLRDNAGKELQEIRAYLGVKRVEVYPTPERTILKKVRTAAKRSGRSK